MNKKQKFTVLALVLLLLLALTMTAFAAVVTANSEWQTVPMKEGTGLLLPCASGHVSAYVDDGMAVVECHPKPSPLEDNKR